MEQRSWSPASVVILSGGQSQRLGRDKSMLMVGGQTLVARTVHRLAPLSDDLIVVTNDPLRYGDFSLPVRFVPDERRGMGALMGVYSGLKAARHEWALTVACDMPFLSLALLRYMLRLAQGHDVVVPRVQGYLEPLHAIYAKTCLPIMAELLAHNRRQIMSFFDQVRVRYVEEQEVDQLDPDHRSFVNINTPEDWERVQAYLREQD